MVEVSRGEIEKDISWCHLHIVISPTGLEPALLVLGDLAGAGGSGYAVEAIPYGDFDILRSLVRRSDQALTRDLEWSGPFNHRPRSAKVTGAQLLAENPDHDLVTQRIG